MVVEALLARRALRRRGCSAVARGSEAAIGEIRDFCAAHGIDAHFRQAGWIWTATTTAQMGSWDGVLAAAEKLGVEPFHRLSPEDVARRTGSPVHRAGVFDPTAATVQPAALARGLRRAALASGVRIYEHTRVRSFSRGTPVILRTDRGRLTAEKLVIASNAWAAGIRELARAIVAITSDMVVTAPAPGALSKIGWTGGECITDSQMMVDYYHATREGRIALGKADGASHSAVTSEATSIAIPSARAPSLPTSGAPIRCSPICRSRTTGPGRSTGRPTASP